MSSFRTIFPPIHPDFKISHHDQILSLGSCFAEHIGGRLRGYKFPSLLNPFGILYNPISIFEALKWLTKEELFKEENLFEHQGLWHSFQHHGQFSNPEKEVTLNQINQSLKEGRAIFKKTTRLILTLGTAHVFEYKKTGKVVANCHKLPGQDFERRKLTLDEVTTCLGDIVGLVKTINPNIKIILTVSPVRHIRDGLVENQRSKSTLLLAIDSLKEIYPDSVFYFPSYEIVLDDLRDYRFFNEDMIHPNDQAINYVWRYFENAFFTEKTTNLNNRIQKIMDALAHRPIHPKSESHQIFLKNQLSKVEQMEEEFAFLNFGEEKRFLKTQLLE